VVVENSVVLELKSCDRLEPIHQAQLLTYLKLSNLRVGLLLNFNVSVMKDGIVRVVNEFKD
jgi:GxxExxY protein